MALMEALGIKAKPKNWTVCVIQALREQSVMSTPIRAALWITQ